MEKLILSNNSSYMKQQDFGKLLIEARTAKGLTQEEVATMCDITTRTIQRIEAGEVNPRTYTIKQISEVLEINFFEVSNTSEDTEKEVSDSKKHSILWYATDLFNLT